jgi:hypothetical protein
MARERMVSDQLFPVRKTMVSDIPAGEGKTTNLFYSVASLLDLCLCVYSSLHLLVYLIDLHTCRPSTRHAV